MTSVCIPYNTYIYILYIRLSFIIYVHIINVYNIFRTYTVWGFLGFNIAVGGFLFQSDKRYKAYFKLVSTICLCEQKKKPSHLKSHRTLVYVSNNIRAKLLRTLKKWKSSRVSQRFLQRFMSATLIAIKCKMKMKWNRYII